MAIVKLKCHNEKIAVAAAYEHSVYPDEDIDTIINDLRREYHDFRCFANGVALLYDINWFNNL